VDVHIGKKRGKPSIPFPSHSKIPFLRGKKRKNFMKASSYLAATDLLIQQALLYCCEDNATAIVVPFGSWGKGDTSTSMFYSFGRSMIGSSRFG
jgi:hypothetical protein